VEDVVVGAFVEVVAFELVELLVHVDIKLEVEVFDVVVVYGHSGQDTQKLCAQAFFQPPGNTKHTSYLHGKVVLVVVVEVFVVVVAFVEVVVVVVVQMCRTILQKGPCSGSDVVKHNVSEASEFDLRLRLSSETGEESAKALICVGEGTSPGIGKGDKVIESFRRKRTPSTRLAEPQPMDVREAVLQMRTPLPVGDRRGVVT